MKRHGHLWEEVISFTSLLRAATKARKGKRYRPTVAAFHFHLEPALWRLHEELAAKTYEPGAYRSFIIQEPKPRQISAAPYRDRVVHHALVSVLEPIFERTFIDDSYACRKGKGTHAAVARCQQFAQRFRYVLKADVQKFFPSLDHAILKELVARKIKDPDVLWLVNRIIDHSNPQEEVLHWFPGDDLFTASERRRGLPIGNQTSQFFANVYLDPLDHFIKERLRMPGYVRYSGGSGAASAECKRTTRPGASPLLTFTQGSPAGSATPNKPIPIACAAGFSIQSFSRGLRPSSRSFRGGAFNHQAVNLRCAIRNRNEPANHNNYVGFRPASTLRQTMRFARPEFAGACCRGACQGKVQAVVPSRVILGWPGQMKRWPGGSGRPHGSKAPPGLLRLPLHPPPG